MEYARLTTALLKDVDETYYYGASCGACHHASRLSLVKLRDHLGGDFPVVEIRFRLKCELCGARQAIVSFLTPGHRTSNLIELWKQKPR